MSRNIVRVNKTKNYTVMSNTHLRDDRLSWKAKGIHSYILSLPDDWKVIIEHLKKVSTDGERATRSGIKELYDLRYWQKYPVYINGKVDQWVTEIYEEPFPEEDLVKSIVIRDGKKTINYVNQDAQEEIIEEDLLCQNAQVGETIDNTTSDLLCQNVDVGKVDVDKLNVDNEGLLNTNNTNDLSFNNNSINQSEKKNERMNEENKKDEVDDTEILKEIFKKAEVDTFIDTIVEPKGIKRSIETLWYRTKPLETNNMKIPVDKLKADLRDLTSSDIEMGIRIFSEQCKYQRINNRTSYLGVCIYNAMFDKDLKIHNDLKVDGII